MRKVSPTMQFLLLQAAMSAPVTMPRSRLQPEASTEPFVSPREWRDDPTKPLPEALKPRRRTKAQERRRKRNRSSRAARKKNR